MAYKIHIEEFGGPEVLRRVDFNPGKPGPGEVLIRQTAIGLNFIDIYQRERLYPNPLPFTPGAEAVGVIEALGKGVQDFKVGDRVAYADAGRPGAYASHRIWPAGRLIKIPDDIEDKTAAGMMVKGGTAEYLIRRTYPVKKGDWVLFHAAAGGVGLIAGQWLNHLGAQAIGVVGTKDKAKLARGNGYHHTILSRDENISERVREITKGRGVDVVFDSVGKDTFEGSLNSLKPRGMMVSFGNASGPVPDFKPMMLAAKGSLYITRPTMKDYYRTDEDFKNGFRDLFEVVSKGVVKIQVNQDFPLKDAAKAHEALAGRKTTGSTVLIP